MATRPDYVVDTTGLLPEPRTGPVQALSNVAENPTTPGTKARRLYHLWFKRSQGTITEAELAELAQLEAWMPSYFGWNPAEAASTGGGESAPGAGDGTGTGTGGGGQNQPPGTGRVDPRTGRSDTGGAPSTPEDDPDGYDTGSAEYENFNQMVNALKGGLATGDWSADTAGRFTDVGDGRSYDPSGAYGFGDKPSDYQSLTGVEQQKGLPTLSYTVPSAPGAPASGGIDYGDLGIDADPSDQYGHDPSVDQGPGGDLDAFGGAGPDVDGAGGTDDFGHDPSVDAGPMGGLDAFGGEGADYGDSGGDDGGVSSDPGDDAADADVGAGGYGDDFGDFGGDDGGGDGGDGGDGGCFLTTAVRQMNGEADDGPTLTKLRGFRDSYMRETPARRQLVDHYYQVGPKITRAIPEDSPEWGQINDRVTEISGMIDRGENDAAMERYSDMMEGLSTRYLRGTGNRGPRPTYEGRARGLRPRRAGRGMVEMFGETAKGSSGIPALDQLRTMSGPKPNGLMYRYDRKKGRVERMGGM